MTRRGRTANRSSGWVPVWAAAALLGRPAKTIRTWERRGHIAGRRTADGDVLVNGSDAYRVATRPGRRLDSTGPGEFESSNA